MTRAGMWMLCAGIACAQEDSVRTRFERFAASIRVFQTSLFFYDREEGLACAAQLRGLLGHQDPKVDAAADPALTFPNLVPVAILYGGTRDQPAAPQTVGKVANQFASVFNQESYLSHRRRGYSVAWFGLLLKRATGASSPVRSERLPRIREVRKKIEKTPIASEDEAIAELKAAGQANVLGLLYKSIISPDVSLRPESVGFGADGVAEPGVREHESAVGRRVGDQRGASPSRRGRGDSDRRLGSLRQSLQAA